jgi:hypothetical protein
MVHPKPILPQFVSFSKMKLELKTHHLTFQRNGYLYLDRLTNVFLNDV